MSRVRPCFFFFSVASTTGIYTLSLHDALPICRSRTVARPSRAGRREGSSATTRSSSRSEEHTSELQSRENLVCRLLLEKKKNMCSATYSAAKPHGHYVYTPRQRLPLNSDSTSH